MVFVVLVVLYLSTSSRATMSPFFRALMAYRWPLFLYSERITCGTPGSSLSCLEAPWLWGISGIKGIF